MYKATLGKYLIGDLEGVNLEEVVGLKTFFRYGEPKKNFCQQAEKKIEQLLQVKHSCILTNCTHALKAALIASKPMPGDLVLIPAISFISTATACLAVGLIPIPIDVDDSGHMAPEALEDFLVNHNKPFAVIAVHLDGSGCQIEKIVSICKKYALFLIEDVARSFGVTRKGRYLGTFGQVGCFSFQENKLLSTGEGGAFVAHSTDLFLRVRAYTDNGSQRDKKGGPLWDTDLGFGDNCKATELMGAVLCAQLSKFERVKELLKKHYQIFVEEMPEGVIFPRHQEDIPTVAWVDSPKLIKHLSTLKAPLISLEKLLLPHHPILKERRSCYQNGFPWNLLKIQTLPDCLNARSICFRRKSLPIPLCSDNFSLLMGGVESFLHQEVL